MRALDLIPQLAAEFGAAFGFQDHPNVEVVAVSDLIPDRRDLLAKTYNCSKTYNSLEELVLDKNIDAVAIFTESCAAATDAPAQSAAAAPAASTISAKLFG